MIKTKEDLIRYLDCDKNALNITRSKPRLIGDEIWKYEIALRKREYYTNVRCWGGWYLRRYWHLIHKIWGLILGFTIHINTIEEGLCIFHYGSIVIGKNAKIGKWCSIHSDVNIGQNWSEDETPQIGNHCFICPGAKLFGRIIIGNNVVIGANAVVNKSFEEDHITIAGIPATIIKRNNNWE